MSDLSLQATALRLITKRGKDATLLRTISTVDPATPSQPIVSDTETTIKLVTVPIEQKYLKNGDIVFTDTEVLISGSGLDSPILASDKIKINGITHRIVGIDPIEPGTVTIVYTVFLRK